MKTKIIEIYYKGEYVCTTTRSKTCKEAKKRFTSNPYNPFFTLEQKYKQNYYNDLANNCIDSTKIRARIKKGG